MTTEETGLRAERARLRRSVIAQMRRGIRYLENLRLMIVGGSDGDLLSFDWPGLQCALARLGALDRRLGRIEQAPLTEEACDAICKQVVAQQAGR